MPRPATPSAPPHALDAEQTLLGALLLDGDRFVDVSPLLTALDFYDPLHQAIYAAVEKLYEARSPVDAVTVADALRSDEALTARGGMPFLVSLVANVPTSSHAVRYAEIVRDAALRRKLRAIGETITAVAQDDAFTATEALERSEQQIVGLAKRGTQNLPQHIADIGSESYERYTRLYEATDKSALFGIRTSFTDLDHILTGLQPGSLTIIAARPGMGKTSLALDIARNVAAKQRKNVALFSLEMSKHEIMDRIIAGELGIDAWRLKKGELSAEDFGRMGKLFDGLREHPIYLDDDPDTTLANLRSKARRQQLQYGLELLIIDYLQLIEVTDRGVVGENRTQQVSHISRSLKNLARELGCPVIALSQLSRSVEQRSPPIPVLSDLRESGSIEQDADAVLMLYRESAYNEDAADHELTDVFVRKNRNGPTGRVGLSFDHAKMSFRA
ncbi:MAG: replicative DNA helicase [Pirellulales bacterium]